MQLASLDNMWISAADHSWLSFLLLIIMFVICIIYYGQNK